MRARFLVYEFYEYIKNLELAEETINMIHHYVGNIAQISYIEGINDYKQSHREDRNEK